MNQQSLTPREKINQWLNSERNYAEGVLLYQAYGRKKNLMKLFPGKQARYARKLAIELQLLVGTPLEKISPIVRPVVLPERKPEIVPRELPGPSIAKDSFPVKIAHIIGAYREKYSLRSLLHATLKKIAPDNRSESVEQRRSIVEEISHTTDDMEVLHQAQTEFEEYGKITSIDELFHKESPKENMTVDFPAIKRKRLNLMKSISTDQKQLDYQSTKKLKVKNPMPRCPKRTEIEKRIKSKKKQIIELDKILANEHIG